MNMDKTNGQTITVYWESFTEENFRKSPSLTQFVRKHSRDHQLILRLPNNQLHKIYDIVLANPELRRQQFSLTNALANSQTEQAFLHGYHCTQPRMFRLCFSVFLPPQILIMEKMVWPHKTIPRWPILIMCHLVVHHHWTNLQTMKILC